MTPEGKVKAAVKAILKEYGRRTPVYSNWPVPGGFGASMVDCIVCVRGHFVAIETKSGSGKPTALQDLVLSEVASAGGYTCVINEDNHDDLRIILDTILAATGAEAAQQAIPTRRPVRRTRRAASGGPVDAG